MPQDCNPYVNIYYKQGYQPYQYQKLPPTLIDKLDQHERDHLASAIIAALASGHRNACQHKLQQLYTAFPN